MQKLIDKYKELSLKYNNLCFKIKLDKEFFIIGIISNDGPIIYKFNNKFFDEFNVIELDNLNQFNTLQLASIKLLSSTDFNNVGYFIIEDYNKLYKYYGNQEIVNIPDYVTEILWDAFKNNAFIKEVNGKNVIYVNYYSFRNNPKLTTINMPHLVYLGNVLKVPNLRHYILSDRLKRFTNEDKNYEGSTICVNGTTYVFNDDLEKEFMKTYGIVKSNPKEQLQLVKIDENTKEFRSVNDSNENHTIIALSNIDRLFNTLPDSIKRIFYETNHVIWIVNELPNNDAGEYDKDNKVIFINRLEGQAFYHEIGHMIDLYLNSISSSIEFKQIYLSESKNIYKSNSEQTNNFYFKMIVQTEGFKHLTSDECEYFAESVNRYLSGDNTFKIDTPNTYEFIKNCIDNLDKKINATLELK